MRGNVGWPDEAVSRVQKGQDAEPHPPEHHGSPKFGGEAVSKQEIQAPAPPTWCSRLWSIGGGYVAQWGLADSDDERPIPRSEK